jgi:hypothetical protein
MALELRCIGLRPRTRQVIKIMVLRGCATLAAIVTTQRTAQNRENVAVDANASPISFGFQIMVQFAIHPANR